MPWERSSSVAAGILSGSREAESEFARYFLPRLRAFFRVRANQANWIEDLTQETLLRSLEALRGGRLRDGERMEAFVLGIARNQCAEAFRQSARWPAAGLEEVEGIASAVASPAEDRLAARRELESLGGEDRRLLWMLLVEGRTPAEASPLLHLSEDAIRQRKSRLLKRLARTLGAASGVGNVTTASRRTTEKVERDGES